MNQSKLDMVMQEMARVNMDILGNSELKWTGMGEFNSDDPYTYYCGQESHRRNRIALKINKTVWNAIVRCNVKNDRMILVCFQGKHHSTPSLCPNYWCQRSWSWSVPWKPRRPFRNNTKKRCPFHHRVLECKSRKSRDTWTNRQLWPWSTKWRRQRPTEFYQENTPVIADTLFQQHKRQFYTWTSPDGQYWNQTDYILCSQRWRSSIQAA